MRIWVDGDACPKVIKEILFRAAVRCKTDLILVANRTLYTPVSPFIKTVCVSSGFDVADNTIIQEVEASDLVVTGDIPLAAAVIEKEAYALNPRGQWYSKENIQGHLARRNFMEELRSSGIQTGGPQPFSKSDQQEFAKALDKFLNNNR